VPRLRGRQERLAPRPVLLRRGVLVRGRAEDKRPSSSVLRPRRKSIMGRRFDSVAYEFLRGS
jgi:hypothetical protein